MRPLGIQWVAGSRLWDRPGETACLAFQRPLDAKPFSDLERMRLDALTPHLRRVSKLHERLAAEDVDARLGLEAMNGLSFGIAILSETGLVVFSNAPADRIFGRRDVFRSPCAGRIAARDARLKRDLAHAIRRAASAGESTTIRIADVPGTVVANAMVLPLPASSRWNASWQRPLVMLVMSRPEAARVPPEALRALFGISAAEARLVNALLAGRTAQQYAEERGLSIETVRSQLKAALAKTNTRSQGQLIAALAVLPCALVGGDG
jgi:DNA-binding CsgD family transcriptional regulator